MRLLACLVTIIAIPVLLSEGLIALGLTGTGWAILVFAVALALSLWIISRFVYVKE